MSGELWASALVCLLLAGCTSLREPVPAAAPEQLWRQRTPKLLALDYWSLTGRIALRADDEAWHASVQWVQRGDYYRVRIRGPLGVGVMELKGGPNGVWLRTAKEERFAADVPEDLLREMTGWTVPVSGLRYWLLGVSEQGATIEGMQLDASGRLESLRQAGWTIDYLRYDQVDAVQLPAKLFLETSRVSVRVVINHWVVES